MDPSYGLLTKSVKLTRLKKSNVLNNKHMHCCDVCHQGRNREKNEAINNNILKRFLKTPKTTSKELIYMETGSTPISSMIDSRQILYYKKNLI